MGHHDSPLTAQGQLEASELASSFRDSSISVILSSDLGRALTTANIISRQLDVPVVSHPGFRERTFGPNYEAKPLSLFQQQLATEITLQDSLSPSRRFSYRLGAEVESDKDIFARFRQSLLTQAPQYPHQNVLVISHEGAIRAFMIGAKLRTYSDFTLGSMSHGTYLRLSFHRGIFT